MDPILHQTLATDYDLGLELIASSSERTSVSHPSAKLLQKDPRHLCEVLAQGDSHLLGSVIGKLAAAAWAKQDFKAAFAFAEKQRGILANEFMSGVLAAKPEQEAAAIISNLPNPILQSKLTWEQMTRWGMKSAAEAVTWALTTLPPEASDQALQCFKCNVPGQLKPEELTKVMPLLTPAAWTTLVDYDSSEHLDRLIPYAPEWMLHRRHSFRETKSNVQSAGAKGSPHVDLYVPA